MTPRSATAPLRYAAFYLLVAGGWILFSDRVLSALAPDLASLTYYQTVKGLFFVGATAAILCALLRRHASSLEEEAASRRRSEASKLAAEQSLRESEERLRQSQKMEAIGQLAGGVAHDFNNMLVVIQGHAELMRLDAGLPERAREACVEIVRAAERAAGLTRQLLLFSRRQVMQLREVDLNAVVADTTSMLRRILGEHIELQLSCARERLPLHADPGMIEQVLLNLAVNARDAMPGGGRLLVQTSQVERGGFAFARLEVADTGAGIPAETLPRVFEPFFTTKEVGKGTGLGLATVFGIVQQHGGTIEADSAVGEGTRFTALFPLRAHVTPQQEKGKEEVRGGSETILLVEDEAAVRSLVASLLARLGYRVLKASAAGEALEIARAQDGGLDLVVTDIVLPGGMSGLELGGRLASSHPATKVVYTSGYSAELARDGGELRQGLDLLAKPFTPRELALFVRRHLDAV